MNNFDTPGVYYERTDADAFVVSALRTDIAGIVGIAERGPLNLAVPVESYRQFQTWFGDTIDEGYLAYCARAYFENGGSRLWVVRVASDVANTAGIDLFDDRPASFAQPAWRVEASSSGAWGNRLAIRIVEVRRLQVRTEVDTMAPDRVRVPMVSGLAIHSLIELRQPGTAPHRAVVRAIDAVNGWLVLDRAVGGFSSGKPLGMETVAYSIDIFDAGRLVATVEDLSLVPEHPRYGPALLKQPWQTIDVTMPEAEPVPASSEKAIQYFRVGGNRRGIAPPVIVIRELRDGAARAELRLLGISPAGPLPLTQGVNGLSALSVRDFVGNATTPFDSDRIIADGRRGLAALEPVEEIAVIAVPDIHIQPRVPATVLPPPQCVVDQCLPNAPRLVPQTAPTIAELPPLFDAESIYRVQAAQIAQCEKRRDRIAVLEAPYATCRNLTFAASELRSWRQRFDSPFAVLYAPWLEVVDPLRLRAGGNQGSTLRVIPPCGHVAGLIAATDLKRGVHVAPANMPLYWVQSVSLPFNDERHGLLNSLGINVLRAQRGSGVRALGARTLASDSDWRFMNVRRLVSMIEKTIDTSIQWAVFEPNDWRTRAKLTLVIGSFLQELWSRGAMVGATPDQAYFVRCNAANNPAESRARGELLVEVGIAPSVPLEFILLRVGRDANGFAVKEAETAQAAA